MCNTRTYYVDLLEDGTPTDEFLVVTVSRKNKKEMEEIEDELELIDINAEDTKVENIGEYYLSHR